MNLNAFVENATTEAENNVLEMSEMITSLNEAIEGCQKITKKLGGIIVLNYLL